MGMELAEMFMVLEDHFDVGELIDETSKPEGTIGGVAAVIVKVAERVRPGEYSEDYVRGVLHGYLRGANMVRKKKPLNDATHLVEDLGMG